MNLNIEQTIADLTGLSDQELYGISGGHLWGCDPSNCFFSFVASVYIELIRENIEHPIGVAGGYPPK